MIKPWGYIDEIDGLHVLKPIPLLLTLIHMESGLQHFEMLATMDGEGVRSMVYLKGDVFFVGPCDNINFAEAIATLTADIKFKIRAVARKDSNTLKDWVQPCTSSKPSQGCSLRVP
jgi:hypothetical protein